MKARKGRMNSLFSMPKKYAQVEQKTCEERLQEMYLKIPAKIDAAVLEATGTEPAGAVPGAEAEFDEPDDGIDYTQSLGVAKVLASARLDKLKKTGVEDLNRANLQARARSFRNFGEYKMSSEGHALP